MILNVDPKVDFAFKYLFGRESNKAVLINMLNSVLDAGPGHEIVDIELLNPAEKMDTMALPTALCQPTIVRAVEELTMLTQQDIEREKYEARRKYQLDHDSALIGAERLGEARGQQRGRQIGLIHAYEQMLQRPETSEEQLLALQLEDLTRLAEELKQQVLK